MKDLTYEEIVDSLRRAEALGDCVPDDIEGTARAIVQARPVHVVVRRADGTIEDPVSAGLRPIRGSTGRKMFLVVCPCGWRWFVSTPGRDPEPLALRCTSCDREGAPFEPYEEPS